MGDGGGFYRFGGFDIFKAHIQAFVSLNFFKDNGKLTAYK